MRASWCWLWCGLGLSSTAAAWDVVDKPMDNAVFARGRVRVGGFVQPRFRFAPADEDAGTQGELGFQVQRMRFEVRGDLLPDPEKRWGFHLSQEVSFDLIPDVRLQDAWVEVGWGREINVRFGQLKVPSNRGNMVSDSATMFPDRGLIAAFAPERDIGIQLHGSITRRIVEYQVGAYNGEGRNRIGNVNRKLLFAARVVVSPLGGLGTDAAVYRDAAVEGGSPNRPSFSLGYAFTTNTDGPPGEQETWFAHNGEAFFHWRFLTATGELWYKTADFEQPVLADYRQVGWYAELSAFWFGVPWAQEHIALLGRVEEADRQDPITADVPPAGPLDPAQKVREESVGIAVYADRPMLRGLHDLRLVLSYTFKQELENLPVDDDFLSVGASFAF